MDNSISMSARAGSLQKYRTLIISLVFLVLLAVSSILTSLYLSSQYNQAFGRYSAMSTGLELHRNLSNALNGTINPNNSPTSRTEFAAIAVQTYDQLVKFYPALVNGGQIEYGYHQLKRSFVIPNPLDSKDQQHVMSMQEKANNVLLIPHRAAMDKLRQVTPQTFASIESTNALNDTLKPELLKEDNLFLNGYTLTNAYRDTLLQRAHKLDRYNTYLPIASIVTLLLFFGGVGISNLRRLIRSDAEIEAARRETQDIMTNVNTGLFLLDSDLNIGNQYSQHLEDIIGEKNVGGRNLTTLLQNKVSAKDLETTQGFVKQLYNPRVKEKLIDDLNPLKKIMLSNQKKQSRFLDFKFSRVYHQDNIDKILVNVQDITQQVRLEQKLEHERAQNDLQIEMLTTILNVSPKIIHEFVLNTKDNIMKINDILRVPGNTQQELHDKLNSMYRIMHSLKGDSSALTLHSFTNIANNFEEKLKELQSKDKLVGNDFLPLTIHLDELLNLSNTIDALGRRINQNHAVDTVDVGVDTDTVLQQPTDTQPTSAPVSSPFDNYQANMGMNEFYQQFANNIATRQNKQVQLKVTGFNEVTLPHTIAANIKKITVQLLRNAVVHGIETAEQRTAAGKSALGNISLSLLDLTESYKLTIEDDGQGLDFDAIKQKAVEMGYQLDEMNQWSEQKLISLLFKPGFTTKQTVDEDAGRGVGMDVIKDEIQQLNGHISVDTKAGKMTKFTVRIPKNTIDLT